MSEGAGRYRATQDDVDNGIYISNIDFVVTIHITVHIVITAQNYIYDSIDVSNINFTVTVDIAFQSIFHLNDMREFAPNMVILISYE